MRDVKKVSNKKPSITAEDACDIRISGEGKSVGELVLGSKKEK